MANDYYNHGANPVAGSSGSSALMRAEFDSVAVGFGLLPSWGRAFKSVSTARSNTTVKVDDPHLLCALTSAGTWEFELHLPMWAAGGGPGGIAMLLNYTGTSSGSFMSAAGSVNGVTVAPSTTVAIGSGFAFALLSIAAGPAPADYLVIKGSVTATSAGNLSLQWAQNSSNANAANIGVGAYMVCTKIG